MRPELTAWVLGGRAIDSSAVPVRGGTSVARWEPCGRSERQILDGRTRQEFTG